MPRLKSGGFTLIELLVVIAIIGILSTLAVIALGNARTKARDTRRVADLKQISTALELYYSDNGSYPVIITPGNSLVSPDATKVYIGKIPSNPSPRVVGECIDVDYTYSLSNGVYSIQACLGSRVGNLAPGYVTYSPNGLKKTNLLFRSGATNLSNCDMATGTTTVLLSNGKYRYTNTVGYGTVRMRANLADLLNGETYSLSIDYENLSGGTITIDWCDRPTSGVTSASSGSGTLYGTAARSTYDNIYRFFDIQIGLGVSVDLSNEILVRH